MKIKNGITKYNEVAFYTSYNLSGWDKILKLLEGVVYCLNMAKIFMEKNIISKKGEKISQAINIIENGLLVSLDFKNGKNIASELNIIYNYMILQLIKANFYNDEKLIDHVIKLVKNIIYAWKKIELSK